MIKTTASPPNAATAEFLRDVVDGLSRTPKQLPCKYFYDARGSELFDRICALPEYYPTRCEAEILRRHAPEMAALFGPRCVLIEYGSGSSRKTRLLLNRSPDLAAYVPVDISAEHLLLSARGLSQRYPGLAIRPVAADFTRPFNLPPLPSAERRVVFFSGSTVGNFHPTEAVGIMNHIARLVGTGGGLLIGVDLKKDRETLEKAYDDARGVTAEFNLNLLAHINRELGADFALERFHHQACYNESAGRIEMHLVSAETQAVNVGERVFRFVQGETICTEYSYKYDVDQFRVLAARAGFGVDHIWTDSEGLYSVQYLSALKRIEEPNN
jgi:L-histidine Nalpha-methyltransferase